MPQLLFSINGHSTNVYTTRRLKAIPWDALAGERSIGMNFAVTLINFKNLLICVDDEIGKREKPYCGPGTGIPWNKNSTFTASTFLQFGILISVSHIFQ